MQPDVRAVRALLDSALVDLEPDAAERRPALERWSIAEIIEHLARTYMGTAKGLQLCVGDGRPRITTSSSWSQRRGRFHILMLGRFPDGVRSPAPVRPKGWTFAQAVERAHGGLDALDAAVVAATERFGARAPVLDHPILGPFSVRDWCRFHMVHTRHHMRHVAVRRRTGT